MRPPIAWRRTSSPTSRSPRRSAADCRRREERIDDRRYIHAPRRGTGGRTISEMMTASILVGLVNIGLAAALLVVYRRVHARTKAPFTLALLPFATAFLAQTFLVVSSFVTMMSIVRSEERRVGKE